MFAGSVMTQTLPQGSTKREHQSSKEASSHQVLPAWNPSCPGREGPPVECPEGLASDREAAEIGRPTLPGAPPPPTLPGLPRTAEERSLLGRHIWVEVLALPQLLCDLGQVAGPLRTHIR